MLPIKQAAAESSSEHSRATRASTIRAASKKLPSGIDLVGVRAPTSAERAHGKRLEARARSLLSRSNHASKVRKVAISQ
jgi:hypothetical protein